MKNLNVIEKAYLSLIVNIIVVFVGFFASIYIYPFGRALMFVALTLGFLSGLCVIFINIVSFLKYFDRKSKNG